MVRTKFYVKSWIRSTCNESSLLVILAAPVIHRNCESDGEQDHYGGDEGFGDVGCFKFLDFVEIFAYPAELGKILNFDIIRLRYKETYLHDCEDGTQGNTNNKDEQKHSV